MNKNDARILIRKRFKMATIIREGEKVKKEKRKRMGNEEKNIDRTKEKWKKKRKKSGKKDTEREMK